MAPPRACWSRDQDITAAVGGTRLRIEFERSGGFAGLTMGTKVDTAELPPEDAQVYERLVESLEGSGVGDSSPPGKPDRFQYQLTITRGKESRRFQLAEQDLTPEARELVSLLVERARQRD
jgi:hypothetical protein